LFYKAQKKWIEEDMEFKAGISNIVNYVPETSSHFLLPFLWRKYYPLLPKIVRDF
jgi:hypothetical protein